MVVAELGDLSSERRKRGPGAETQSEAQLQSVRHWIRKQTNKNREKWRPNGA